MRVNLLHFCWRWVKIVIFTHLWSFSPTSFAVSRRSARFWLSSFSLQTAYRPVTIVWRYYNTSIFTSRRDGPEKLGFPVTLGPDCLKFRISKNSVFQDQYIFSKNRQNHQKKNRGAAPRTPSLRGCTPPTHQGRR